MDFLELAKNRFSVLDYTQQKVNKELIDKILDAGLAAPTACNKQPQKILIIDDEEGRSKLYRVIPGNYDVPLAFLICYDRNESWIRPMDGKCSGEIDASIVATHMMLEITDLGLGSIWVMSWNPDKMKLEFNLPDNIEPVALLVAGHKAENARPKKGHLQSKNLDDIVVP